MSRSRMPSKAIEHTQGEKNMIFHNNKDIIKYHARQKMISEKIKKNKNILKKPKTQNTSKIYKILQKDQNTLYKLVAALSK